MAANDISARRRPGVYCSGEVPNFQIVPALAWMARHLSKTVLVRFDDYLWPRQAAVVPAEACSRLINLQTDYRADIALSGAVPVTPPMEG